MWDVVFEGYKDAKMSLAMGFTFDVSPVENECMRKECTDVLFTRTG